MSAKTGISWTDATWNPIRGCSRVSEGCRHCYAEQIAYRFSGPGQPYEGLVRETFYKIGEPKKRWPEWNGKIKFVEEHLLDPLKWKGKPIYNAEGKRVGYDRMRIFVNSMSDLYHENVTDEMRDKIYAVMGLCPQHTFQVLTKRPERRLEYLGNTATMQRVREAMIGFQLGQLHLKRTGVPVSEWSGIPLPNVWEGVSIEDQPTADKRVPVLLQTPAAVRFLSAEPLLKLIDLENLPSHSGIGRHLDALSNAGCEGADISTKIDWVIVGGESGPGARPMHPDWARSLRDQCRAAGVSFFFKQWGEWMHGSDFRDSARIVLNDGRVIADPDEELSQNDRNRWSEFRGEMMAPVGAKAAGCLLDGVEHHEFPAVGA